MDCIIKPLFPLNLVAFPGEDLNLHIFEPRYRQLFKECENEGKTFVICPYYKGHKIAYGTEMRLEKIHKKYANGKMDVRTRGMKPVKILAFYKNMIGKLYGAAEINYLPWDDQPNILVSEKIISLLEKLYAITKVSNVKLPSAITFRTFALAHKIGFSMEQEINFLKISAVTDRQEFMLNHLTKLVPIIEEVEEMKRKVMLNGHFKNIIPPG